MGWPDMLLRVAEIAAVVLIATWVRSKVQKPTHVCESCPCEDEETEE